jgi:hypothetical protein
MITYLIDVIDKLYLIKIVIIYVSMIWIYIMA